MELLIDHVSKSFKDKKAVRDFSLNITPGVWGLLGANGAGKTTLIRIITGIMKPGAGQVVYDGIPIEILKEKYKDILGYLPQEFGFPPEFSVKDYLEYVAALKDVPARETTKKINHLLEVLTLSDVKGKKIAKLSGGMKRRVGIAQAMLNDPKILVMDEPTAGLDPGERVRFRNFISEFSHDRIVLISTHIVSDVEVLANEILIIDAGKLIKYGTRSELINELQGRVWEYSVGNEQAVNKDLSVISTRYENDYLIVRVLAPNKPYENARKVNANLEDIYFYLFSNFKEAN